MKLDLVVGNARVYTMDPGRPVATRLGIWQGRVAGLDEELDGVDAAHVVDAGGKTVLPGFVDAHTHLVWQGLGLSAVDISAARGVDAALAVIDMAARQAPPGWLDVTGYDQRVLGRHLSAADLDPVTHGHKLYLRHVSGHACVVSSEVLRHVSAPELDASPGVDRLADGGPSGLFLENAQELVLRRRLPYGLEELRGTLRRSSALSAAQGVTFCAEAGTGAGLVHHSPVEPAAYQDLSDRGELAVRVQLMVAGDYLHPLGVNAGYARTHRSKGERLAADFAPEAKFDALTAERAVNGPTAFLTVQEGCDKFCTFCVVPYTRGAEWSRPVVSIVAEAQALADKGVRELTLLGQNVNAYNGLDAKGAQATLARLMYALAEVPGIERLRYTTSHPNDMGDDLIDAHRDLPQVMPYLHLPVQSGSDRILRAMNRKHGRQAYFDLVDRIRAARPDLALSGDFIVGFPGETDKDFEDTLDLIRRVGYASAFSFKYSPRPGTPAAAMPNQVEDAVADARLQTLQALIIEQQQAFKAALVGQTLPVLFDKPGRYNRQAIGRSPYLQSVYVEDALHLIGQIRPVRIIANANNSLKGALIDTHADA